LKLNLDPYQNEYNWLDKKEVIQTKEEGFSDKDLIRDFDVSKSKFKSLLNGTLKKIKIGKFSPHFDYEIWVESNPINPLSRAGWLNITDTKKIEELEKEIEN